MTATEWFMKAQIEQLEKENKNLKIELWWVQWERDGLKMVVDKLHKEIETLENELTLKENLNEELRKKIDKYKSDLLCFDDVRAEYENLQNINKKLKAELDKYKNDIIYEEWLYD